MGVDWFDARETASDRASLPEWWRWRQLVPLGTGGTKSKSKYSLHTIMHLPSSQETAVVIGLRMIPSRIPRLRGVTYMRQTEALPLGTSLQVLIFLNNIVVVNFW